MTYLKEHGLPKETNTAHRRGGSTELYLKLAEWVTLERLCCPFLTLALVTQAGSVRLELTGSQGVVEFLTMELGLSAS
jgi:hypothetical protein